MSLRPPAQIPTDTPEFSRWCQQTRPTGPWELFSYTVASLPPAANFEGSAVYVRDETGGKTVAFSDGTNWRRVQDRAICA
jgi:hypothetical protein